MKHIYPMRLAVLLWLVCLFTPLVSHAEKSRYDLPYYSEPGIYPAPTASTAATKNTPPTKNKIVQTTHTQSVETHHLYTQTAVPSKRSVSHFSAIDIAGPFQVTLSGGRSQQAVTLDGDPRAVARVTSVVVSGALILRMRPQPPEEVTQHIFYNPWVRVKINSNGPLSSLRLAGATHLTGYNINSYGLTIETQDQAGVKLQGNLRLDSVLMNGSGGVSLSSISGSHLNISGFGANRLFLAGRVDILDAHLGNAVRLAAMQLPARLVYVQTQDNASADVWPEQALYAFASGNSNIFYTHVPDVTAGHSQDMGNILLLKSAYTSKIYHKPRSERVKGYG